MRRFVLTVVVAVLAVAPGAAQARGHATTVAPPGNSAVSQYLEDVPTAGGSQPTNTIHPGSGSSSAISSQTAEALAQSGAAGKAAAALADATAPANTSTTPGSSKSHGGAAAPGGSGGNGSDSGGGGASGGGSSPLSSVVKAVTGSGSGSGGGSGMGPVLPAILLISLLGAGGFTLRRRRSS